MKLFTWIRQLLPAIRSEVAINLLEEGCQIVIIHNPESRDIIQQNHLIDIIKTWIQKEPGR